MRYLMILLVLLFAACNPDVAWKTTATVREAAFQMEAALAKVSREKSKECLGKFKKESPEYGGCIKQHVQALQHWIQFGRPAVNSALVLTVSSLQIAEQTKTKVAWLEHLRPALCGLSRTIQQWGHLLPPTVKQQVETVCKIIVLGTCEEK